MAIMISTCPVCSTPGLTYSKDTVDGRIYLCRECLQRVEDIERRHREALTAHALAVVALVVVSLMIFEALRLCRVL